MAPGDYYHKDTGDSGIADGESLVIDLASKGLSAVELNQITGSAAASIYYEVDPDGDGVYEFSVEIDTFSGAFHTEGNSTRVRDPSGERIRVENTSGGTAHYTVSGTEIIPNAAE